MTVNVHESYPPVAANGSVASRIAELRRLQNELKTRPVTGSVPGLKKLFYQVIRSTFSRQFTLNAATIDVLESMYRELERQQPLVRQQAEQMQAQAGRSCAPESINGTSIASGETLASCGRGSPTATTPCKSCDDLAKAKIHPPRPIL